MAKPMPKKRTRVMLPMCASNCTQSHTIIDFAVRRGVSRATVYRWIQQGMPVERTGFIRCDDARRWAVSR